MQPQAQAKYPQATLSTRRSQLAEHMRLMVEEAWSAFFPSRCRQPDVADGLLSWGSIEPMGLGFVRLLALPTAVKGFTQSSLRF